MITLVMSVFFPTQFQTSNVLPKIQVLIEEVNLAW